MDQTEALNAVRDLRITLQDLDALLRKFAPVTDEYPVLHRIKTALEGVKAATQQEINYIYKEQLR